MPLKKKTAHGSLWNLLRTLTTNGIDFVVYALLARVLSIEEFALVIFCLLIVEFASIFPRVGVAQNLIQRDKWELDFASSTFTFMTSFSLGISALLAIIGSTVAYYAHSLQAVYLVLSLCIIPFVIGMHNVLSAKMERDFKQGQITAITAGANIVSGLLAIVLIFAGWGIWALVLQKVLNHFILLILFAFKARFMPNLSLQRAHLHELKTFCLPLLGTAVLTYVNRKANNFYAALVLGAGAFALVSIAKKSEEVLTQSTLSPINKMIVPSLSRLKNSQKPIAFYRLLEMTAFIVIPCFLGLGAVAQPFIILSFGEAYGPSAVLLSISSFAIVANILMWFLPNLLISIAKTKAALWLNIVNTGLTLLVGAFTVYWGLEALIIGLTVAFYFMLPIKVFIVKKHVQISLMNMIKLIFPACMASLIMVACIYWLRSDFNTVFSLSTLHPVAELIVLIFIGACIYLSILFTLFKHKTMTQIEGLKGLFVRS